MGHITSKIISITKRIAISSEERITVSYKNRAHSTNSKFENVINYTRFLRLWVFLIAFLSLILILIHVLWKYTEAGSTDKVTHKLVQYSFHYFGYCFILGALSTLPHLFILPADILKCRIQVGKCKNFSDGITSIFRFEAECSYLQTIRILYRGWEPTLCGYLAQGGIKFFLYEVLKYWMLGPTKNSVTADKREQSGLVVIVHIVQAALGSLIPGFVAEIVADLALAPCEAVKIKIQTSGTNTPNLLVVIRWMWEQGGISAFYKGLVPLWCRQVPSTVVKFLCFERIVRLLYLLFFSWKSVNGKSQAQNAKNSVAYICLSLIAGALAGIICAVVSHPADTIVSKLYQTENAAHGGLSLRMERDKNECSLNSMSDSLVVTMRPNTPDVDPIHILELPVSRHKKAALNLQDTLDISIKSTLTHSLNAAEGAKHALGSSLKSLAGDPQKGKTSLLQFIRNSGWRELWRGLLLRTIMISFCSAMQWVVYDSVKVLLGFPTTGGS